MSLFFLLGFLLNFSSFLFWTPQARSGYQIRSDRIGSRLGAKCHVAQQPTNRSVAGSVRATRRCRRRCRCRSQMGRLFPFGSLLLAVWCVCLLLLAGGYGEGGNESERVWGTRRRTCSPSQSGSEESFFSLSAFCESVQPVQFLLSHRSFLSRSFLPRQSTVQVQVQGRGALSGFDARLPAWFFFFWSPFDTATIPAPPPSPSALLSAIVEVCLSAFALISAVISGWTQCNVCHATNYLLR